MNCLEFRRICLAEPGSRAEGFVDHRQQCEDCARYADSVNVLNKKIENALHVPVPEDLATRIKLRQVMLDELDDRETRRFRPWRFGLAASVLLTVALASLFGYEVHATNQYIERLTVSAVDHTRVERQGGHFVAEHEEPVKQNQRFKQVLAAFGAKVMDDELAALGDIVHVQVCALDPELRPVAHFVIKGASGLVTFYYVMGRKLSKPEDVRRAQYEGMLVPVGQGNLAVIGKPGEQLQTIIDKLEQAVIWQI